MNKRIKAIIFLSIILSVLLEAQVQPRDYRIHKRGMLWQTVFNTGEIGRAYDSGAGGGEPGKPAFEWPGNSAVTVDGKQYQGQYCTFGGGVFLSARTPGVTSFLYALCGGCGGSTPEAVINTYSFPLYLDRVENYPINSDGTVNSSYNENEAEEKITAKWGTNIGLTITRVSRVWSNPHYDDMIIYEYEIEHTGDRYQSNGTIVHSDSILTDVLISFTHGLAPSMFGYERKYNQWRGSDYEFNDGRARWDRRRWLAYAMDRGGKPDPVHFVEWAPDGINGGGLCSPQAVGYMCLYYDTTLLAHKGESKAPVSPAEDTIVWDNNMHFKQPFVLRMETKDMTKVKMITQSGANMDIVQNRNKNHPNSNRGAYPAEWIGRGSFNWRQARKFAVGRMMTFGPYIMRHGDKVRFSIAEVAGYGAATHEQTVVSINNKNLYDDEGGGTGELGGEDAAYPELYANNPIPCWDTVITYGVGGTPAEQMDYGFAYLNKYKLPDYVNSKKVITIRDVAERAINAYNGGTVIMKYDSSYYWPDTAISHGVYKVPMAPQAPPINVVWDSLPRNLIVWKTAVDSIMKSSLSHYEVLRSPSANGPWKKLDSIGVKDPRFFTGTDYRYPDYTAKLGEYWWYTTISVNLQEDKSSWATNRIMVECQTSSSNNGTSLKEIYVVPNPFLVKSGYRGDNAPELRICFVNLPKQCTIRIFSYAGQLVNTLEHTADKFGLAWYQVTRNNQQIAPGLYFFVVDTPTGQRTHGKFVVIR